MPAIVDSFFRAIRINAVGSYYPVKVVGLVCVLLSACQPTVRSPEATEQTQQQTTSNPIAPGKLTDDQISFQFGIYFLSTPTTDPLMELDSLLNSRFTGLRRVSSMEKTPELPTVHVRMETEPQKNAPLPGSETLIYSNRGVTEQQLEQLEQSHLAMILTFGHSKKHVWNGLKSANELVYALAESTGGLIWDNETREIFSAEEWDNRRFDDSIEAVPNVIEQIVIHIYPKGTMLRAITLGMAKFGLPDIVIDQTSRSSSRNAGHIINLLAQALAEGAILGEPGKFDLDFRSIKHPEVREPQISTLKGKATGVAHLFLRQGTWEEGDPHNRLIEISFERGKGSDAHSRQEDILSQAFGFEDSIVMVQHEGELNEASRRAREKLPSFRVAFQKGLSIGEYFLVKAPFQTSSGGTEWMWVEVTSWEGDKIKGILQNDPFDVPDLKAGESVNVMESKVFDYIHVFPDGRKEGNETAKVIEKQSKSP